MSVFDWGINTCRIFIAGECSVVRAIVEFDRGHLTDARQPSADASRQSRIRRQGGLLPTSSFQLTISIWNNNRSSLGGFSINYKLIYNRRSNLYKCPFLAASHLYMGSPKSNVVHDVTQYQKTLYRHGLGLRFWVSITIPTVQIHPFLLTFYEIGLFIFNM